jgi:RNA polymerase sigma-70 factor (ECF subfamily)
MTADDDSQQRYESFTRLFLRNEKKVRAFVRAMMASDAGVDDVVQEVALVAWRKFSDLKEDENFGLWACVMARYEVLKWRRKQARDRLVFSEKALDLLATAELENVDRRERERSVLDTCLQKLSNIERTLVMSVHTPGSSVARIADETGQPAKRLYRKVSKLRLALQDCMTTQLTKGDLG